MTCQTCGRDDGHYIGCEAVMPKAEPAEEPARPDACEHEGCSEPKWSNGPRTKFCEAHKDPKNREK